MPKQRSYGKIGGWDAPSERFDYREMEREAQRECDILQNRLRELKARCPKDGEGELLRRREVCLLTDIYYEQRYKARLFHRRAEQREHGR